MRKILQLSDTHLFSNSERDIFGVKSNITFNSVIAHATQDIKASDLILLTGDLSQDETAASYEKIADTLSVFNKPIYWIPGNHDSLPTMNAVFKKYSTFYQERKLDIGTWSFIFLNTKLENNDAGYLSDDEIKALEYEISHIPFEQNIVIVMHHHPVQVNTPLIDKVMLKNHEVFWNIINKQNVKLIICGHVHGDYKLFEKDIFIESSPATCFQLEKGATELSISKEIGYKIYDFSKTGYTSQAKIWPGPSFLSALSEVYLPPFGDPKR
jgi:Icc protein